MCWVYPMKHKIQNMLKHCPYVLNLIQHCLYVSVRFLCVRVCVRAYVNKQHKCSCCLANGFNTLETEAKWLPFCRQYVPIRFLEWQFHSGSQCENVSSVPISWCLCVVFKIVMDISSMSLFTFNLRLRLVPNVFSCYPTPSSTMMIEMYVWCG